MPETAHCINYNYLIFARAELVKTARLGELGPHITNELRNCPPHSFLVVSPFLRRLNEVEEERIACDIRRQRRKNEEHENTSVT